MDSRVANLDQLAYVRHSVVSDGRACGCRALDVAPYKGIHLRLLPDRGLDIGRASYDGIPISWTSPVGECGPGRIHDGDAWLNAFGGGLLTTCGLRNVGDASEGHGLHGAFSFQRAENVVVRREKLSETGVEIEICGEVSEVSALDYYLRLERRIRVRTGEATLEVDDLVTNCGGQSEPAPILYHINFGFPLLSENTRVEIPSTGVLPRDPQLHGVKERWSSPGPPEPDAPSLVLEHLVEPTEGEGRAWIRQPDLGVDVELAWSIDTLPRLHQWLHVAPHIYVMALEPANCTLAGRAADRDAEHLPWLEPGERRRTAWRLRVNRAR